VVTLFALKSWCHRPRLRLGKRNFGPTKYAKKKGCLWLPPKRENPSLPRDPHDYEGHKNVYLTHGGIEVGKEMPPFPFAISAHFFLKFLLSSNLKVLVDASHIEIRQAALRPFISLLLLVYQ
jgi:hypothetical protein